MNSLQECVNQGRSRAASLGAKGALLALIALGAPRAAQAVTNTTRFLQAETAATASTCGTGYKDANHLNFTGTGFANCDANATAFIQWTARVQTAGNKRLSFRYANASANRPAEISVNGVVVSSNLAFNPTANWDTWATAVVDVPLLAGNNVIKARGTVASAGLANIDRLDVSELSGAVDWGIALAESTMLRAPLPQDLGPWEYSRALVLHGMYLLYKRVGDPRYLDYLKAWVDKHINSAGDIVTDTGSVQGLNSLDYMLPGNVVLDWWLEDPSSSKTQLTYRYRRALQTIRNRITEPTNTSGGKPTWNPPAYPRTSDSGLFHNTGAVGQLWLDGVFMGQKFNVRFGNQFGDSSYANNEATTQLTVQHGHLKDPTTGLLFHAYDEQADTTWVVPGTHHSSQFWCRAMGWYGMTVVETLETLPTSHAQYAQLLSMLQGLVGAWANFQDPATGRWFQVVNQAGNSANWTETSCSAMLSYVISKAVQKGYVAASFQDNANRGMAGVLQKISYGADSTLGADLTNVTDISEGTNVGDNATYYYNRQRPVNDRHGLGAFLIMWEHFQGAPPPPPPPPAPPSNLVATAGDAQVALSWTGSSGATSYTVKRSTSAGSGYAVVQGGVTTTSYLDPGRSNGTTYYYVVSASNTGGESLDSAEASATPQAAPPPQPPTGVNASGGNGQVVVGWNASVGATSYTVKRSTSSGSGYTTLKSGITTTSHTDTTVTNGTTYFYVVSASNGSESGNSAEASATPMGPAIVWSQQDIPGTLTPAGSFSENAGTFTVAGAGADIWTANDQFHFVYRNITGNATIIARVASVEAVDAFTKAGIMMRAGLADNAVNVAMITTPTAANSHRLQVRATTGATTGKTQAPGTGTAPVFFRLVRQGNTFTGYTSATGSSWTQVGTPQNITMPSTIAIGLAITSHHAGTLATGSFDSVTITTP